MPNFTENCAASGSALPISKAIGLPNTANRRSFILYFPISKNKGLIEKKNGGRGSVWRIKPAGLEKLNDIKKRKIFSASAIAYRKEPGDLKTIAFNVPAKEDRQRYWLRAVLKDFGFEMFSKSVWIGKKKIPEFFKRFARKENARLYPRLCGRQNRFLAGDKITERPSLGIIYRLNALSWK